MKIQSLICAVALSAIAGGATASSFADKVNQALNEYQGNVQSLVVHQENLEDQRLNHILNGGDVFALNSNGQVYNLGTLNDLKDLRISETFSGVDYVEAWVWSPGWQYDGTWTYNNYTRWDIDLDSYETFNKYIGESAEFVGTGRTVTGAILDLAENVFEEGFHQGYTDGFQDGYEQGYADGYIDGYRDGVAS